MKWPAIGIIVVFCLQLGLVAYTAIDLPIETLVAVNEIAGSTTPVAREVSISNNLEPFDGDKIAVSRPAGRKRTSPATTILASSKKVAKVPGAPAVNRTPQLVASREPSRSKIKTEYPRVMAFDREPDNYPLSARAAPESKKKSFLSKSFSVIKKPYHWLKSLGSKIN